VFRASFYWACASQESIRHRYDPRLDTIAQPKSNFDEAGFVLSSAWANAAYCWDDQDYASQEYRQYH
jgi:hypothetical protein